MTKNPDWREAFFGREQELQLLLRKYEEVATGQGPRLAVVLGDRGMGKTRLVQELYRKLLTLYDSENYWPDASLFAGNNLRVAPDLRDEAVKFHFNSFAAKDRPMPFLWWGFRLSDSGIRNAARTDLAAHRETLDLHLGPTRVARKIRNARSLLQSAGVDAATELGKSLLKDAVKNVPGVGLAATVFDLFIDYRTTVKDAFVARREEQALQEKQDGLNPTSVDAELVNDLHVRTLDDLKALLEGENGQPGLPCIVFCDDAQFAGRDGDEGALRLLTRLWEDANHANYPLLLVLTHWSVEWHSRPASGAAPGFAAALGAAARSTHHGALIELPKESALSGLVRAGMPSAAEDDITLLLGRADGNPQVLIELVELVRLSPAWRNPADGRLFPYARKKIEESPTDLRALIVQRLNGKTTPVEVRQAVGLSSLQGMEFLCTLTEAAAQTLSLDGITQGLAGAQFPHGLVLGIEEGLAGFVQRAYREAAEDLVGGHVGDPAAVKQALLDAAIAIVDNIDRCSGLSPQEQTATWGVLVGLATGHPDAAKCRYAGKALLQLIRMAVAGASGADYARAAELAASFENGLTQNQWKVEDFDLADMMAATKAVVIWRGHSSANTLAVGQLRHAREIATRLNTFDARSGLSQALDTVGAINEALGDLALAGTRFRESLDIRRELAIRQNTHQAWRFVAASLDNVGAVAQAQKDWGVADEMYREGLKISREWEARQGGPAALNDVSVSLDNLGAVAQARNDWAVADEMYRESLRIRGTLVTQNPKLQRALSVALENVGSVAHAQENLAEADRLFRESLGIRRELAIRWGTPDARRDVSVALEKLGSVAHAQGNWAEADRLFRESLDIRRELATLWGTPGARHDLSLSLDQVGSVAYAQANWAVADGFYRESLQICREIVDLLGTSSALQDLSVALTNVGGVAEKLGEWAAAHDMYYESLDIHRELIIRLDSREALRELGLATKRLAILARESGDRDMACEWLRDAEPIFEELALRLKTPQALTESDDLRKLLSEQGCGSAQAGVDGAPA